MLFVIPLKKIYGLFPPLFFHIHKSNRGVSVPSPFFGLLPVLDGLRRAEMDTGTAEFAVVLPERFFIHHFDIFHRADCRTGPARRAFFIGKEVLVGIMDSAG